MTREKFLKRLDEISKEVATWPAWKRECFDASFDATNPTPREPVEDTVKREDVIMVAESFKISVRSLQDELRAAERQHHEKIKDISRKIAALQRDCPHPTKSRHYCQYESYDECDYCGKEL